MADLSVTQLALIMAAVAVGGLVQGSIGFGLSLVAAPAVALIRPEAMPATLLLLSLPMTATMAFRERHHLDVPGFLQIMTGRVAGTAIGALLLALIPGRFLTVLFGACIVVAAGLAARPALETRRRRRVLAGVASGTMATAAAVGGPPLAIAYRDRPGPVLRSTLALSFLAGTGMSLLALAIVGRIRGWHAVLALELAPALLLGVAAGATLTRWLDARWLRPAVLLFAGISGAVAIVESLMG